MITVEEAKKRKGYQHRADNEFIFGVDDIQEIYDCLVVIYGSNPKLAERNSKFPHKNAFIREELEMLVRRPIADTDKDFSGRTPHWGDLYLSGKMVEVSSIPHRQPEPALTKMRTDSFASAVIGVGVAGYLDVTSRCTIELRKADSGGSYVRLIDHTAPHTTKLAATCGHDGIKTEKGYGTLKVGGRSFRILRIV